MKRSFTCFVFSIVLCLSFVLFPAAGTAAENTEAEAAEIHVINGLKYKLVDTITGFTLPMLIENTEDNGEPWVQCILTCMNDGDGHTYFPQEEFRVNTDSGQRTYSIFSFTGGWSNCVVCENVTMDDIEQYDYVKRAYTLSWEMKHPERIFEKEEEYVEIDGHLARLVVLHTCDADGNHFCMGGIKYNRDYVWAQYIIWGPERNTWEDTPRVDMDELREIAKLISYHRTSEDERPWPFYTEHGNLLLDTKNGDDTLVSGKKMAMSVTYENPEKVRFNNLEEDFKDVFKNIPLFRWSVTDAETGEEPEGITINDRGELTAGKGIDKEYKVIVKVTSSPCLTTATKEITVIPAATGITAEPADVVLYEGKENQASVKAVVEPESIPNSLITWKTDKSNIVEIVDNHDGTALITPLKAGKINVTATEPGGKKATVRVSVVVPVEGIELKVSGQAKPGGTVQIKPTLSPKNAGNKKVEWSIDVGEEIATVKNGTVKIKKDVPAGTVIKVTCTAPGAPEPISETVEIEVQ